MKLISARSLKPAILFDFASNVLLSSLTVLPVSSSARIIVENKWQRILCFFQRIEFSMFLGYLVINWKVCTSVLFNRISNRLKKRLSMYPLSFRNLPLSHPSTPWNFRDPLVGGGYGYFLEPQITNMIHFEKKTNILYWQLQHLSIVEMASLPVEVRSVYLIVGGVMTMTTAEINQMKSDAVSALEWFLYRFTGLT